MTTVTKKDSVSNLYTKSNSKRVIDYNDLFFPIYEVSTQQLIDSNGNVHDIQITGSAFKDILIKPNGVDTPIRINTVSNIYRILPNHKIFGEISKILDENGIKYTVKATHRDYHNFSVDYIFEDERIAITKDDIIYPKMSVVNSYDGSQAFFYLFGYYRLVCSNGLVLPVVGTEKYNTKYKKKHFESLNNDFSNIINNYNEFILSKKQQYYIEMNDRVVKPEDRILEIFQKMDTYPSRNTYKRDENKKPFMLHEDLLADLHMELTNDGVKYNEVTDWYVYNFLNSRLYADNKKNETTLFKLDQQLVNACYN